MGIENWSPTPADNATGAPNINIAVGSAPSTVHPSLQQMMADVATWHQAAEWLVQNDTPTYVSAMSFTVPGNRTNVYSPGRRVQATGTTAPGYTVEGTISSSTAGSTTTTVDVTWDSGSIDSTVDQVAVGILQNQLSSIQSAISALSSVYAPISGSTSYAASGGSSGTVFSVGTAAPGSADAVQAKQLTDGSLPITASSVTSGATGTTHGLNDNSTKLATTADITGNMLGSPAQAWTNVTSSRAFGATYTNFTGRPIEVAIFGYLTAGDEYLQADIGGTGNLVFSNPTFQANAPVVIRFIVPLGQTYVVTAYSGSAGIITWAELR